MKTLAVLTILLLSTLTTTAQDKPKELIETWQQVSVEGSNTLSSKGFLASCVGSSYWVQFDDGYNSRRVYFLKEGKAQELLTPDGKKLLVRDTYQVLGERLLLIGDGRRDGKSNALWCVTEDQVQPVMVGDVQLELKVNKLWPVGNGRDYFQIKHYEGNFTAWRLNGANAEEIRSPDDIAFENFLQCGDDLVGIASESTWVHHGANWLRLKGGEETDVKLHARQRGNFVRYLPMALGDLIVDVDPDRNLEGVAVIVVYRVDGGKAAAMKFGADVYPVDVDIVGSTLYVSAWRVAEDGARSMSLLAQDGDSWKEQAGVSAVLKDDARFVLESQTGLLTVYKGMKSQAFRFSEGDVVAVKVLGDGLALTNSAGSGQNLFCSFAADNIEAIQQRLGRVTGAGEVVVATDAGKRPLIGSDWDIHADSGGCYARSTGIDGIHLYYLPAEAR